MSTRTWLFAGWVAFLAASSPTSAQVPVPIALSGTPAPTGGNYGPFSIDGLNTFLPVVNESGRIFFYPTLTGGSATAGLFVGNAASVQTVALQGTPAPAGGNFTNSYSDVRQNSAGQVVFSCSLAGGTAAQGLFAGQPGALQTVALSGTAAPSGGNYSNGFSSPLMTESGRIMYAVNLTDGGSTRGLFTGLPGAIQTVALQGSAAPAGGNYTGFFRSTLNTSGQVAFYAEMTGGTAQTGIFHGTPGSLQTLALQGNPAPAGGDFNFFGAPVMNDSGRVAFLSSLANGSATSGIFAGTPGALQTVALNGDAAPAGGDYSTLNGAVVMNGAGRVAFLSALTGGSATSGIFVGGPGTVEAVALQGVAAPGGGTFDSFPAAPHLNNAGQLAFVATLAGAGVDASNDRGLYAGSAGALVKIVREGDQIDVDPGAGTDLRTISGIGFRGETGNSSGGQDGRGISLTESGFITFNLNFTDGSSGAFVTLFTPVPEPATIGWIIAIGIGVGWWKRA